MHSVRQFCVHCGRTSAADRFTEYQWILPCRCHEEPGVSLDWQWFVPNEATQVAKLSESAALVTFHPLNSQGTAIVRGTVALSGELHYWEVKVVSPTYGTDMMVGVGLVGADFNYYAPRYFSALGRMNIASWGLSYRGDVVHCGQRENHNLLAFNRGSIVGCFLDLWHGKLQFFVDGKTHGYSKLLNLPRGAFYPMVCSTASRSGFRLIRTKTFDMSLQLLACRAIRDNRLLPLLRLLPSRLRDFLTTQLPWAMYLTTPIEDDFGTCSAPCTNSQDIGITMARYHRSSNTSGGRATSCLSDPLLWTTFSRPDVRSVVQGSPRLVYQLVPVSPLSRPFCCCDRIVEGATVREPGLR
ncbi:SPRY domain-containing SOCS box protein 3 [Clonorchis sinensis]|uniref:SPRY domain-containing SOCS box protein 3 n=1 Tax=Clonorchis sinensis TaxID=79923 RepID=A0A8T1M099_CLOSI|nr:SPRY domain-containing SOCS box protein 3 [Clonorchis sinensis]